MKYLGLWGCGNRIKQTISSSFVKQSDSVTEISLKLTSSPIPKKFHCFTGLAVPSSSDGFPHLYMINRKQSTNNLQAVCLNFTTEKRHPLLSANMYLIVYLIIHLCIESWYWIPTELKTKQKRNLSRTSPLIFRRCAAAWFVGVLLFVSRDIY